MKNNKYKIKLEDSSSFVTYDDIILKYNILLKKELDSELINKITTDTVKYVAYDKVLKYLNIKMRSTLEIERYLDKLNVEKIDKENIITKLKENNLLDDKKYVVSFINDKIMLTNDGPYKIKKELIAHDIDEKIIDEELNKYDMNIFIEKINKLINKKLSSNKDSSYMFKQKITNYLINLGYNKEQVLNSLNNINFNESNNLKKDYEKIYNKCIKKYQGKELIVQIKSKLYRKGYQMEDINEFIDI